MVEGSSYGKQSQTKCMRSELFFIVAGLDNNKEINEDSQGRAIQHLVEISASFTKQLSCPQRIFVCFPCR